MGTVIDIVKPEPRTELGLHKRWMYSLASSLMPIRSGVKKINIQHIYECDEYGVGSSYYSFGGVCGRCEALGERGE